eukprot:1974466-Amphidinium_carterae.1
MMTIPAILSTNPVRRNYQNVPEKHRHSICVKFEMNDAQKRVEKCSILDTGNLLINFGSNGQQRSLVDVAGTGILLNLGCNDFFQGIRSISSVY